MEKEGDLPVLIEPLLACLRQERYTYIKDLYIWQYPMNYENAATLVSTWALLRENLSSGFLTKRVSNQSPQLQRLAGNLKFHQ